ncbi:helix-hairpin-helix domain-containing protein [Evansella sp. AB-P1]|uniref:helix-hairpin-helix domain-containing protein n=1 Tax=Evansella sp. AB-P1 TaxID=3037653 RepID=UPI00241F7799|nr:helix-hairpin-helix domain-containing protein [Evansella sp. AB-P1]MDG5786261.1 helix-hairpin-helix domain-containing protein [Evansella sp. AB-P1]
MGSNTKLPLTHEEKSKLRKANVLKGLAEFQTVPSVGYKLAEKLVFKLYLFSLSQIKDKNAAQLFDQLEKELGVWTDSCVEDQIRCVVNYANDPKSNKQWFDFTEERKAYRGMNGFPQNRPINAWYE